ncbi:protein NETWORKED 2A-like [Silene latifolia]|uniref:protein NETWORKED 2A-like n=1 Tax=Silene latifolia TaxID=37657 RepID=UPI003D76BAEB
MLHRAATTAYSWWWASHIRTKQSKWLEQNLQEMEEKVQFMLKIIEQEGDSFAKRAEMYYKKRPELITSVEESYKAYRALAERFDHISKDLQSANRTIATVFPEQVHLGLESDDDDMSSMGGSTAPSPDRLSNKSMSPVPKNLPKPPKLPKQNSRPQSQPQSQSMLAPRRENLRRNLTSPHIGSNSGLSKDEAAKEVDSLEKDILSMQTEKEFLKSAYDTALAKFLELETRITESQSRVCSLQDEFDIGTSMEDHEARNLMIASALKSCAQSLSKLQDEQKRSMEEVKDEYERIREAHERLYALKKLSGQLDEETDPALIALSKSFEETLVNIELKEGENVDAIKEKIREQLKLNSNAVFTEPELAENIDDLVEKIVRLETTVCSQNALVKRLRQEIDELLKHIKDLEDQKQPLVDNSAMGIRLRELEEELRRVKSLNQEVVQKKMNIDTEIVEASCNLDHLTEKLQDVKPYDGTEYSDLNKEAKAEQDVEEQKEDIQNDMEKDSLVMISQPKHEIKEVEEEEDEEKPDMFRTTESITDNNDTKLEDGIGLNWRQLYMNNLEDREKILVEEYTIILRDYKGMKMKLSEMEKQHRDNIFELASHVKELRDVIAAKDEEIRMLRKLLSDLQASGQGSVLEGEGGLKEGEQNNKRKVDGQDSSTDSDRKPLFHHLYDRDGIIKQAAEEGEKKLSTIKEATGEKRVKLNLVTKTMPGSRTEDRFRSALDNLLEANLDFWLRFSTAFHQIQKFQTSIRDLQEELVKLKGSQKKQGNEAPQQFGKSDAMALYKHFREIQTELTLWLEHSAVFQEELKSRFSSLNNIQGEINQVSSANRKEENELSDYQSAKFQGEILNMKQENSKVAEELQAGIHRVKSLKLDVEKALAKLDKEFGFSESKSRHSLKNPSSKPRIPLHSFLFGVRLKKQKQKAQPQSFFACVNPTIPKDQLSLPESLE